jgi:serine/threonine-protein kinase RsbW
MSCDPQPTPAPQIELSCRISTSMLSLLRDFVCCAARHMGFSDRQVGEIEICVDEACANAVEHAYDGRECHAADGGDRAVRIEIAFAGDELTIRICDTGTGSEEPLSPRIADLAEYADPQRPDYRGLGLYMIYRFMDRVAVHSTPGRGTVVEMTKVRK